MIVQSTLKIYSCFGTEFRPFHYFSLPHCCYWIW